MARALTLTDVNIQTARAESLRPASFDTVTLRAVERFESILPVAATLVAPTGRLALLIGEAQLPQAHALLPTMTVAALFSHPRLAFPNSGDRPAIGQPPVGVDSSRVPHNEMNQLSNKWEHIVETY